MHPTIFCKAGDKHRHRVQKAIPKNLGEWNGMKLPECPRCKDIYSGE